MDNGEVLFWTAILRQASKGNTDAQEMLQAENELRGENNQPTVQEELKEIAEREERLKHIQYPKRIR